MANRFFTLLIVPEKTSNVRKIVVPSWLAKGLALSLALFVLIATVMLLDYWYVMSQIGENKQLRMENRRLRQQVQVFKNKVATIEDTMERVKTFATRLKVITNIEDRGNLLQSLNGKLPDSATNIGENASSRVRPLAAPASAETPSPSGATAAAAETPEDLQLRREYEELDERFSLLNRESLFAEQTLQDLYELLADQKAFLAALPTRKPAVGYFTNGFGIRRSPFGGRVKMHEGLDIANRPGTTIKAPADGVVNFASSKAGYGLTLILDHGYGLETWYAHTQKILVSKGQKIRRGDSVAQLGNSGRSTGPHLHYEVRVNGYPVDPLSYILEN
ncbi:MAG: M23 family metallopeptidase [Oligoflexia bacterium]|nr:M23 family metallopeptidase [Oligoflexia bacterium]